MQQLTQFTTLSDYLVPLGCFADTNAPTIGPIISQIAVATKIISNKVKRAGIENLIGSSSVTNFHNEEVQTLDILSNIVFITALKKVRSVFALISEEEVNPISCNKDGDYLVCFDPLDGSSNIDANVNIGSIFGIFATEKEHPTYVRQGKDLMAAGYALYGSSTLLIVAFPNSVNGFTLDETIGEFVLTHPSIRVPETGSTYSINEGYCSSWTPETANIINYLKSGHHEKPYSLRYIGSMVADVHRTLLYGGLFINPPNKLNRNGKLRYLYEVAPFAFIMEQAGGRSTDGLIRTLDHLPSTIHERVPVFMGSLDMMCLVDDHFSSQV